MALISRLRTFSSAKLRNFFVKDESGTTAVEFALIISPFFAMLFFLLLGGHILWMAHSMDTAVRTVSREIKTGQAQAANMTLNQFRAEVCSYTAIDAGDCQQNLIVDVRRFPSPANINFDPPIRDNRISQEAGVFEAGDRLDYVIVKVYYMVDYLTIISRMLGNAENLDVPLSATAAFRNEPF